jgi:transposase
MVPMAVREIIIADHKDGMSVPAISEAFRVSEGTIYRLLRTERETGSIGSRSHNSGRKPEVGAERLSEMEAMVAENPDITLQEIKEAINLSIQKSEISNILRNKLGFRYKKNGACQRTEQAGCHRETGEDLSSNYYNQFNTEKKINSYLSKLKNLGWEPPSPEAVC